MLFLSSTVVRLERAIYKSKVRNNVTTVTEDPARLNVTKDRKVLYSIAPLRCNRNLDFYHINVCLQRMGNSQDQEGKA